MGIEIIPSGAALGAEIRGADLRGDMDEATFATIRAAFYRHEVVCLRGQVLTDEEHIRFTARFGSLRRLMFRQHLNQSHPEIFVVSNIVEDGRHIGSYDAGLYWHTDGAYVQRPHAISALRAIEVPERDGRTLGDTRFASMTAAYDALPEAMQRRLEGLTAAHSLMHRYDKTMAEGRKKDAPSADMRQTPDAVHPVVRVHPVTGRRCLYVSEGYTRHILGLPADESEALLSELVAHCTKPEFQYVHNWRAGDLLVWDDCSTQHRATFDYGPDQRRLMHRTTVEG